MDMDFAKALQGFDEIWQRVQQQKTGDLKKSPVSPPRKGPQSRARRFNPGRR